MLKHPCADLISRWFELRLRLERHQPGVRRGHRRHVRERLRRLHEPRAGEQHRPEHLRPDGASDRRRQPQGERPRRWHPGRGAAGCQGRPGRSCGQVDRLLLRAAADPRRQAIRNAKTLVASKQPVGVPALPVFNKAQYDLANTWIKSYINVPLTQMSSYTCRASFNQHSSPELPKWPRRRASTTRSMRPWRRC